LSDRKTSVADSIAKMLVASRGKHYVPKRLSFNPSTLSSPCERLIFYKYLRIQPDFTPNPKSCRIFEAGDALHGMMKDWVRRSVGLIDYRDHSGKIPLHWVTKLPDPEFPVDDSDTGIKGKMDGVGVVDGQLWIYEFKSIKAEYFRDLSAPQAKHQKQAAPYVFLFEKDLRAGKFSHIPELDGFDTVAGVIYLYLNKDNQELKEFRVEKSFEFLDDALRSAFSCLSHVQAETLPEKTEDHCYNCDFRLKCAKDFNPLKKI
jgi:hypothetical protein